MLQRIVLTIIVVLLMTAGVGVVSAQTYNNGTDFTYQGFITDSGTPITNTCNLQFSLWNALTAGTQIGTTQTVTGVSVVNGIFTVVLDFGLVAFDGQDHWLQIGVDCPVDGIYTTLSPRQALTPAPYAVALYGMRTEPNNTSPNVIGGFLLNTITSGVVGGTIGGGGSASNTNRVTDAYGTIGGGGNNRAGNAGGTTTDAVYATVGGGVSNAATASEATIAGGDRNTASGLASTVGGGELNTASANFATIAGGAVHSASGANSTIGGGSTNTAANTNAAVGGGQQNTASGISSTIGGGLSNRAENSYTFIGGGQQNIASGVISTVSGGGSNTASGEGATVGGGGNNTASGLNSFVGGGGVNNASGGYSVITGGQNNEVTNLYGFIGGGDDNNVTSSYSTIGGGQANVISTSSWGVIGGGISNTVTGASAAIGGGFQNRADGALSMIPGGQNNSTSTDAAVSFAAGISASVTHSNAFVWSGSSSGTASWGAGTFTVRAPGGVRIYTQSTGATGVGLNPGGTSWVIISDRNQKENISQVDNRAILETLAGMDISTYNYIGQDPLNRTIGVMAQDFHAGFARFGFASDDTTITTSELDGVALASIQGLYQVVQEQSATIDALQARIDEMQAAPQYGYTPLILGGIAIIVLGGMFILQKRNNRA